jgi:hypothetical protein
MSKAILDALKIRLLASGLATSLGSRIALDQGAADLALPLMVYRAESVSVVPIFGGEERVEVAFVFDFFADSTNGYTLHGFSTALETALATVLTATGYDRVTFIRTSAGTPTFVDDGWTMSDRYKAVGFKL